MKHKTPKHTRKIFYLRERLQKAGIEKDEKYILKFIFFITVIISLIITLIMLWYKSKHPLFELGYYLIFLILICFPLLLIINWYLFFYAYLDLRAFKRKTEIENVLPDFLQLVSANVRAGMTLDRAMWYSIRPRFGVLAKEMEKVAKESMSGKSLNDALNSLVEKFDSVVLKRSISLIIEGLSSGGKMGDLLNRLAISIQEIQIRRKEMAANITTYIIFISFATVLAAPVLFALCTQLIRVINIIGKTVDIPGNVAGGFALTFKSASVSETDFMWFAIVYLLITSFFSSMIIATIKKGSVKAGIKYIFIFTFITISIYFLLNWVLGGFFGFFVSI